MEIITKEIKVYEFKELDYEIKQQLITDFGDDSTNNHNYWHNYATTDQGAFIIGDKKHQVALNCLGINPNTKTDDGWLYSFNELTPTWTQGFDGDFSYRELHDETLNKSFTQLSEIINKWVRRNDDMPEDYIISKLEQFKYLEDGDQYSEL